MDVAVNRDGTAERHLGRLQLFICVFWHWCAPQIARPGMYKRQAFHEPDWRQIVQPFKAFFAQFGPSECGHLLDHREQRLESRRLLREELRLLRRKEHFVGVAQDSRPSKLSNAV